MAHLNGIRHVLAAEARRRPDLTVIEADVVLTEDWRRNRAILVNAARHLSAAEVIHFQHKLLWGNKGRLQLYYLWSSCAATHAHLWSQSTMFISAGILLGIASLITLRICMARCISRWMLSQVSKLCLY